MEETSSLPRHDDVDYNAMSDQEFRKIVGDWIDANYPPELRHPIKRLHLRDSRPWYQALSRRGWLAPSWPREHGGMGLAPSKLLIMHEQQERHGCARLNDIGMAFIGPLLIQFGAEAQRQFFLPKILSGEHIWCQGYSEPNAGSDLASLRTKAVLDGDEWVVNGQKIWTTLANDANWIFLLVRTDPQAKKQEGISFLLVPLDTPGVTVRPIINLDMHDEFCEVFFDDVRVPRDMLVGTVNKGWSMAKALLGFERIHLASPQPSSYAMSRLRQVEKLVGGFEQSGARDRYVRLCMDLADHSDLYEFHLERVRRGEQLGAEVSMMKLNQSELNQRITEFTIEMAGELGCLLAPLPGPDRLNPGGNFIQARLLTIAGGSSEIQRNIIAKNVLGLPS
ncbi:acyl-CoA dehydrogenase family protein [Glaciimonas sp. PCH181]|uniref:acyl-CoA dehydrogenase family protein n=1 Tax=Glaciimonas sp. PCH181 TaxID=2133943 RepID=UPI000D334C48|nr:acyl-CoA dehydrogenase family protein [Glaciimonas sp. PCH181]PUA19548.1 acyl-CoA dehydrogenase [Glaciimonas sp. PCH181]